MTRAAIAIAVIALATPAAAQTLPGLAGFSWGAPCDAASNPPDAYQVEGCYLPGAVGCAENWKRWVLEAKDCEYVDPTTADWTNACRRAFHPDLTEIPPGRTITWWRVRAIRDGDPPGAWAGEDPDPFAQTCPEDNPATILVIDLTGVLCMEIRGSGHQAGLDPSLHPCRWPPVLDAEPATP